MKKLFPTILIGVLLGTAVFAQDTGIPLIGSKAPSFTANSTNGKVTFPNDFGKSWKILFSHPQDFTPVCTSELLELAWLQGKFDQMNIKMAVISTDNLNRHNMWKAHLEDMDYKNRGKQKIHFPIFEDQDAVVSGKYGMLHKPVSTTRDIRGVFIIDSKNIVRSVNFYPMEVGRNMEEIIRIVEALKITDNSQVLTPANWKNGDDVLVPHFPYTQKEVADNPELSKDYYSVGNQMWFKKLSLQASSE